MNVLLKREFLLKFRNIASVVYPIVFFSMVLVLFPIATGANTGLLAKLAVTAIWVAVLLSILLGLDRLFNEDLDDGMLEQIVVNHASLSQWVFAKLVVHWLGSGFLLALLACLAMPLFGLSSTQTGTLMLTILIGSPTLVCMTGMASALTVSLKRQTVLVPLIALPLQLPIIIFATGAVNLAGVHVDIKPVLALLSALSLMSILCFPFAIGATLRMALAD